MEVEMKGVMTRFTNDAIATCAFGLKCDSFKEQENEFYKMGQSLTKFKMTTWLKIMVQMLTPSLAKVQCA